MASVIKPTQSGGSRGLPDKMDEVRKPQSCVPDLEGWTRWGDSLSTTMNLQERTKHMPKADFNQEFPTRASLRRARQAEVAAQEQAKDEAKKTAEKPRVLDEFDAVPESGLEGSPAATTKPGPASPVNTADAAKAKTAPTAASSAPAPAKPQPKPAPAKPAPAAAAPARETGGNDTKSVNKPAAAASAPPSAKPAAKPAAPAPAAAKAPQAKA
ncbi:MAG: hypothetical protein WCC45_02315, partial [Paeniglutamicibacter sp.]